MSSNQAKQTSNDIQFIYLDTPGRHGPYEVNPGQEVEFALLHSSHGVPKLDVKITQGGRDAPQLFGSSSIYTSSRYRVRSDAATGEYQFRVDVPDTSTDVRDSSKRHDPREPIQGTIVVNPGGK
jgi:hypothetical protein